MKVRLRLNMRCFDVALRLIRSSEAPEQYQLRKQIRLGLCNNFEQDLEQSRCTQKSVVPFCEASDQYAKLVGSRLTSS